MLTRLHPLMENTETVKLKMNALHLKLIQSVYAKFKQRGFRYIRLYFSNFPASFNLKWLIILNK